MKRYLLLAAMLLSVVVGCNKNVGMSGKVTFSDDGAPLTTGTICFQSETGLSRGQMNADGSFTIGSIKEADGLPKGDYVVYFSGATEEAGADASGMPTFRSLVDPKYSAPETTPLKISVTGKQKIELKVDRPESETTMVPKL